MTQRRWLVQATRSNQEVHMAASVLQVGELAPDFNLRAVITKPQVARIDIKLSDWRGKRNVVLAFHPFAFTAT